ncbi:AbrB/MazE/SpoVT family DNA-binding domain-containing protein [Pyrolobus fumarii]|uniref:AbrB/MazE/SpoVT family DNA-binding domain-containing protein n=1 Tax=Pyrolobus fumarii TaxID=54252 RepID=UPI00064EA666|nr:AbrB/MazE/SpoVT family DNA-binding domain-containing protein [Pyrolobus fumarii]
MTLEARVRVSKKYTIYLPKALAEAVGVREGSYVRLRVEGSRIILEPEPDPFTYALRGPKYAETTFEEFERESEEMQRELLKEA